MVCPVVKIRSPVVVKTGESLLRAAGITYAVGKTAKAYFASGMMLSKDELMDVFTRSRKEADNIDWRERKVEADENHGGKDIL